MLKILIIDDELQRDLFTLLNLDIERRIVLQPRICHSAQEALDLIKEYEPNVIILDLQFSKEDLETGGPETARQLREEKWPGIIISNSSDPITEQKIKYTNIVIDHFASKNVIDNTLEFIEEIEKQE